MEVVQTVPILRIFDVAKLSEHDGDSTPGATVFLRVTGLQDFHAQLGAKANEDLK